MQILVVLQILTAAAVTACAAAQITATYLRYKDDMAEREKDFYRSLLEKCKSCEDCTNYRSECSEEGTPS